MKVFISHSLKDRYIVDFLQYHLSNNGITAYIAEHYLSISSTISDKILKMINDCDIALIFITNNGFNSDFIQQEIGALKAKNKHCITIVQKGCEAKITGFLYGTDYFVFDNHNLNSVLNDISNWLIQRKESKEQEQSKKNKAIFGSIAVILGFWALGNNNT
jgi:hypothetical protein